MEKPKHLGFSLIGMLVSLVCIMVISSIMMSSMNKTVTGNGEATSGSVWGMQNQIQLQTLVQGLTADSFGRNDQFLIPSVLSESLDISENTSANFWSALIAQNLANPEKLIAKGDNGWVEEANYDWRAVNSQIGQYWDPNFSTDFNEMSNVSYAHMPLYGERLKRWWRNDARGIFPIIGNRGPRNGQVQTDSFTLDKDGQWRGWVCYSDGSIKWYEETNAPIKWSRSDDVNSDNLFILEGGDNKDDAILGVTSAMDEDGPTFIWD
jgi:type II secretory pathway pseudopilin PulG